MENNFSEELINEMSRDMCFQADSCTVKSCYKVNCEKTWLATNLLRQGWQKPVKAEWKPYTEYYADDYSECNTRKVWTCSRCGRLEKYKEPYCNCGARMTGGENQ